MWQRCYTNQELGVKTDMVGKKDSKNTERNRMLELLGSGWGLAISICSIFGFGYGAGATIQHMKDVVDKYDELMVMHQQQDESNCNHAREVFELRQQIYQLEQDNINLRRELNETK